MDGSCNGGTGAVGGAADKPTANPPPSPPPAAAAGDDAASAAARAEGRRPFTSLSQEEADLALARVLQEQERAYMMLTGQGGGGYEMFDAEGYDYYDDDEDDDEHGEEDVSDYEEEEEGEALDEDEDDEEVGDAARHEGDDVAGRLMALEAFRDWQAMEQGDDDDGEDEEEDGEHQDAWEDVDPDEYSYEELVALGEVVGTESRGLPADAIASLPSVIYQAQDNKQDGNMEQCVICRVEFDEGESLVALPCKHSYHSECINHWLQLNKVCPMCSAEVSTAANKKA